LRNHRLHYQRRGLLLVRAEVGRPENVAAAAAKNAGTRDNQKETPEENRRALKKTGPQNGISRLPEAQRPVH
jgi:hypothetical protein